MALSDHRRSCITYIWLDPKPQAHSFLELGYFSFHLVTIVNRSRMADQRW